MRNPCRSLRPAALARCDASSWGPRWNLYTRQQSPLTAGIRAYSSMLLGKRTKSQQQLSTCLKTNHQALSPSHNDAAPERFHTCSPSQSSRMRLPKAPTSDPDAEATLSEQLRSVLRLLTNPVVICTASHGGKPRAMTMSSFTSLSLTPTPLVSFNVATPSRTLDAIQASQEFNVHILAGNASGVMIADHFTRGNADDVFSTMESAICMFHGTGHGTAPLIQGEGILRVLCCKLLTGGPMGGLMPVRDHVIVVGEVVGIEAGLRSEEFGLAYADRKYRQVGSAIDHE